MNADTVSEAHRDLFLASKGLSAFAQLLTMSSTSTRLLFLPTASNVYDDPTWIDEDRQVLMNMGLSINELDLDNTTPAGCVSAMAETDAVYVAGGNTFYLLQAMQRIDFASALRLNPAVIYARASAGAVIATPDVAYVSAIDDRSEAPELTSTAGLGLVPFRVLPHFDHEPWREKLDWIVTDNDQSIRLITLRDDQAIIVRNGSVEIMPSPSA